MNITFSDKYPKLLFKLAGIYRRLTPKENSIILSGQLNQEK